MYSYLYLRKIIKKKNVKTAICLMKTAICLMGIHPKVKEKYFNTHMTIIK